ncbi:L-histidine N(alpha)-methyltransferase [Nocardia sp. NPDC059177]|uniref:L-histidine N(alpha)-methyltransferase n=1 Tax=Nocardia sp. NPDC059177 TaxID=3346759 RepID=UPI00367B288F
MDDGLYRRMERALGGRWDRWMHTIDREDPRSFLQEMVRSLRGDPARDHTGKRVQNKHRYIGLVPTIAWMQTSKDPSHPLTYESIATFGRNWDELHPVLSEQPYHYVSLGVGTGDKDRHILDRLHAGSGGTTYYMAVDISTSMLNLGTQETRERMPGRVLLMEMDFEDEDNLEALRAFVAEFAGDEPILYSLLGGSLGNVDDDALFLRNLAAILRPQDRLVLEVATTARLDEVAVRTVERERGGNRSYNEFVTAALAVYTNLTIDTNWLDFSATVVHDAIRVEGVYVNRGNRDIQLMLPNREFVPFRVGERIEVLVGRRYTVQRLARLLDEAHLGDAGEEAGLHPIDQRIAVDRRGFSNLLILLRYNEIDNAVRSPLQRLWADNGNISPRFGAGDPR